MMVTKSVVLFDTKINRHFWNTAFVNWELFPFERKTAMQVK